MNRMKPFDYKKAFAKASRKHKVWEYPKRPDGSISGKGRYVIRPEAFRFAMDWKPKLGVFKYKRRSECTFDPNSGIALSYSWWCFLRVVRGKYIFNSHRYSVTTGSHQSMVKSVLHELGIRIYLQCNTRKSLDAGLSAPLSECYRDMFQAEIEQARKNAKPQTDRIRAVKQKIDKLRSLGAKLPLNETAHTIKACVQSIEARRLKQLADAAATRKAIRDRVKAVAKADPATLNPQELITEPNAEVRRMLFQRIGADKALAALNASVIDTSGTYQLVNLDLKDGRHRPFLKMLNPSTGETHVEGVPPGIETVTEALAWRNSMSVSNYSAPKRLT